MGGVAEIARPDGLNNGAQVAQTVRPTAQTVRAPDAARCGQLTTRNSELRPDGRLARVARGGAEFFLDAQQLVVLGDAIRAACRARLDLARSGADGEIGDRGVFGFAGSVRDDRSVACVAEPR